MVVYQVSLKPLWGFAIIRGHKKVDNRTKGFGIGKLNEPIIVHISGKDYPLKTRHEYYTIHEVQQMLKTDILTNCSEADLSMYPFANVPSSSNVNCYWIISTAYALPQSIANQIGYLGVIPLKLKDPNVIIQIQTFLDSIDKETVTASKTSTSKTSQKNRRRTKLTMATEKKKALYNCENIVAVNGYKNVDNTIFYNCTVKCESSDNGEANVLINSEDQNMINKRSFKGAVFVKFLTGIGCASHSDLCKNALIEAGGGTYFYSIEVPQIFMNDNKNKKTNVIINENFGPELFKTSGGIPITYIITATEANCVFPANDMNDIYMAYYIDANDAQSPLNTHLPAKYITFGKAEEKSKGGKTYMRPYKPGKVNGSVMLYSKKFAIQNGYRTISDNKTKQNDTQPQNNNKKNKKAPKMNIKKLQIKHMTSTQAAAYLDSSSSNGGMNIDATHTHKPQTASSSDESMKSTTSNRERHREDERAKYKHKYFAEKNKCKDLEHELKESNAMNKHLRRKIKKMEQRQHRERHHKSRRYYLSSTSSESSSSREYRTNRSRHKNKRRSNFVTVFFFF